MKNEWLKTNIVEILALGAVFQFLLINLLILFKAVKTSENTTIIILTSSTNVMIMVMAYYFGSSKGSKDKQTKLDEQVNP